MFGSCLLVLLLLAAGGAQPEAAPEGQGSLFASCWASGLSHEFCCVEPRQPGAYNKCFDSLYTPEECCRPEPQGGGWARRWPDDLPEPPRAPGASLRSHPSYGRRQRAFEERHALASKRVDHSWISREGKEVSMRLHLFKRSIMVAGNFVESLQEYFTTFQGYLEHAGPSDSNVFIDIGASVGIFAVAMAMEFPEVVVVAVEPAPQNYRYLLWNIRENNLTGRIWPVNAAMRGASGPASLSLQYSPIWPIATQSCPMAEESLCEFRAYSVPALSFAALLSLLSLERLTWLKVDCEGCEWELATDPAFLLALLADVNLVTVEFHVSAGLTGEHARAAVRAICPPGHHRDELMKGLSGGPAWARSCSRRLGPRGLEPPKPLAFVDSR